MLTQSIPEITISLFFLVFFEGILSFISPCILPMLPVYLIYLGGEGDTIKSNKRLLLNVGGFILGFTTVFVFLGATVFGFSRFLYNYQSYLQRISGIIMIIFGLQFLGAWSLIVKVLRLDKVLKLHQLINFNKFKRQNNNLEQNSIGISGSYIFGLSFSFGWTPCLGPFLGSALMLAANSSTAFTGIILLFLFSLGLGIPFIITALFWSKLQGVLRIVKQHLKIIKIFSGGLLILVGLVFLLDWFGIYLGLVS